MQLKNWNEFRVFSIKGSILEVEEAFDVSQLESWDELKALVDSLENRGVSNVRINFGIVRGLDYYSGIVFEVFDKNSTLGALAGGGRYDTLTKAFNREDIGAIGVAGGVERIVLTMQEQKIISEINKKELQCCTSMKRCKKLLTQLHRYLDLTIFQLTLI